MWAHHPQVRGDWNLTQLVGVSDVIVLLVCVGPVLGERPQWGGAGDCGATSGCSKAMAI